MTSVLYMAATRGPTKFTMVGPLQKWSRGCQTTANSRAARFRENSFVGRAALGFSLCSLIASSRLLANKAEHEKEKEELRIRLMTVIDTEAEKREELLDKAIDAAKAAGLPAKGRPSFAAELKKFSEQLKMTTGLPNEARIQRTTPATPSSKQGEIPEQNGEKAAGPKQATVW